MLLNLNPHRVSINPSVLVSSAEELLSHAGTIMSLKKHLNWDPEPEVLVSGFPPQRDAKRLIVLMKEDKQRRLLKEKRLARGFEDFATPRTGFKGWCQKKFHDPKELRLASGYDVFNFLRHSARLMLLASLHDALLSHVSSAEPRRVEIEESAGFSTPLVDMITGNNFAQAEKMVKALNSPLAKVSPDFIINGITGYVMNYDRKKSMTYYLA